MVVSASNRFGLVLCMITSTPPHTQKFFRLTPSRLGGMLVIPLLRMGLWSVDLRATEYSNRYDTPLSCSVDLICTARAREVLSTQEECGLLTSTPTVPSTVVHAATKVEWSGLMHTSTLQRVFVLTCIHRMNTRWSREVDGWRSEAVVSA